MLALNGPAVVSNLEVVWRAAPLGLVLMKEVPGVTGGAVVTVVSLSESNIVNKQ